NPRNRGGSTGHVLAKRSVTFTEIRTQAAGRDAVNSSRDAQTAKSGAMLAAVLAGMSAVVAVAALVVVLVK
ncbi:hypothetical protein, partial [Pseudomonas aeruginosa]|uniref:hypothetical protein n=1 Tax=Pseudomonas aeruginosa TaxID=287 RepID=UPI003D768759